MKPWLFQVALSGMLILGLAWTRANRQQRRFGRLAWAAWSAVWLLGLAATWFPDMTTRLAHRMGITRGVDLVLYVAVTVILLLLMGIYGRFRRIDRSVTLLSRQIALSQPMSRSREQGPSANGPPVGTSITGNDDEALKTDDVGE